MKKMTKLMSVLLAIAMLFAMAIPVASVAADDPLLITVETVEAEAGAEEVEVKLYISAEPHWSAIDITFNFDPEKLTFVEEGFETNEAVSKQLSSGKPAIFALNEENAANGEVLIAFASSVTDGGYEGYYNVDRKGNVYDYFGTFLFDVAEGVSGLQEITVTVGKLVDADGENVEYTATNGGIQIPVAPHDHDWSDWEVTTPATCTEPGEQTRTCSICGEKETEEIPIDENAHEWGEWEIIEEATYESEGLQRRYCLNNQEHFEEEVIPKLVDTFEGLDIVVETVAANAGDKEVEVKLYIPAEPHWSAIDVTFNFDPSKLTFVEEGFETNEAVSKQLSGGKPAIFALNEEKAAEGEILIAFASSVTDGGYEGYYNVDKKGNVYDYFGTFLFDVADDAENGLHEITVTVGKLVDADSENVEYRTTSGGIEIGVCEHEWEETSRTPATCTEDGVIVYTCSKCGETKEEPIEALGHDWGEWEVVTPATCSAEGEQKHTCALCGEEETEAIPIDEENGHDWVEIGRTDATCVEPGVVTYVCSINVDHTYEEELPIDPDAHQWGEWEVTIEPEIGKEGEETRTCELCGATETRPIDPLEPAHEHVFGEPTYEWAEDNSTVTGTATCTDEECGETIEATAQVTVETTATCTEAGVTTYTATFENDEYDIFGTVTKEEDAEALGHDWGEWEVTKEATETEEGEETRTCARCGETETRVIPIVHEHTFGEPTYDWADDYSTVTGTATCTVEGCDETITATADATLDEEASVPATCTEAGKNVYTATFEDDEYDIFGTVTAEEEVEALGHDWGEWEVTKEATYEEEGEETRTCNRCGETETRAIDKLEPEEHDHVYGEPTYEWADDYSTVTGTATCTVEGCDETITATADATLDEEASVPATCTEAGKNVYTATFEDDEYDIFGTVTAEEEVEALGHDWGEWEVTKEATYEEEGEETRTCARCGEVETRVIPKLTGKAGDMDGDGEITVADALRALRIAAKLAEETPEALAIGDIDGDGEITVADALKILRVAAKLADEDSLIRA